MKSGLCSKVRGEIFQGSSIQSRKVRSTAIAGNPRFVLPRLEVALNAKTGRYRVARSKGEGAGAVEIGNPALGVQLGVEHFDADIEATHGGPDQVRADPI